MFLMGKKCNLNLKYLMYMEIAKIVTVNMAISLI